MNLTKTTFDRNYTPVGNTMEWISNEAISNHIGWSMQLLLGSNFESRFTNALFISLLALAQAKALKLQPISFEINRNGKLHDTHIIWSNRCRPKGERWLSMEGYIVLYTQIMCLQKWLNNIHFEALQCKNWRISTVDE